MKVNINWCNFVTNIDFFIKGDIMYKRNNIMYTLLRFLKEGNEGNILNIEHTNRQNLITNNKLRYFYVYRN